MLFKVFEEATTELANDVSSKAAAGSEAVADAAENVAKGSFSWSALWQKVAEWCVSSGLKILIALVILLVSFWIIRRITKKIEKKIVAKGKMDKTLTKAIMYGVRIALQVLVIVCLIGFLGIDTTGISALIASLGVAVGLAVNGTLSNLAGGIMILITRPFKDDDYISACGYEGTVEDIRITHTKVRTNDNKMVYLPNGTLSTSAIVNFTEKDLRRVDLNFAISYSEDFAKAEKIILDIYAAHSLILDDPAGMVRVLEHSKSAITLVSRAWCKTEDYWTVYFDLLESVKKAFDENGIEIPFEQIDVHVKNN